MSIPISLCHKGKRRKPSSAEQQVLLEDQRERCFYCGIPFDVLHMPHYDHILPFVYSYNNRAENFVASCQECNLIKGCKVFDTITEAMIYVREQKKRRKSPVFELFGNIRTKKEVAEVLLSEVPDGLFLEDPRNCTDAQLRARIAACKLARKDVRGFLTSAADFF